MISKALENIEESIEYILEIVVDKGKRVMYSSSKETIKEQFHVEEIIEDIQNCKVLGEENGVLSFDSEGKMIVNPEYENEQRAEETEILNLRKTLQHYQKQNGHLNHINDQLVKENSMIRRDLEDMQS